MEPNDLYCFVKNTPYSRRYVDEIAQRKFLFTLFYWSTEIARSATTQLDGLSLALMTCRDDTCLEH
jgi:hypothetical protein